MVEPGLMNSPACYSGKLASWRQYMNGRLRGPAIHREPIQLRCNMVKHNKNGFDCKRPAPSPAAELTENGLATGELLKRQAHDLLKARRAVFVRRGQRALLAELLRSGTATIDDARDAVSLPPHIGPKLFGAVPGPLLKAGIITPACYVPSRRAKAHARPVLRWVLIDRRAANAWLTRNPDLVDE
jgi:hypothetical protein